MERIPTYLRLSERVPGWTRGGEAQALIETAFALPGRAVIVEIGAFLGSGSILLAGARKLRRSGHVHCVDPFDGSGDAFSVPHYTNILAGYGQIPQLELFRLHLRQAGLANWVSTRHGTAEQAVVGWSTPVDMIFMDADQSSGGVHSAYHAWEPWLKLDGVLALHNSNPREYAPEHDGHFRLRQLLEAGSDYVLTREVDSTTFFRKKGDGAR
jgi:predicted O-methyltransferase YrrM